MSPELRAAHEKLTEAIEVILRLEDHAGGHVEGEDTLVAMDFLVVVWTKNMRMIDLNRSGYSYLMKDGGHTMPAHVCQGLARRLYDWANDDSEIET